MAKKPTPIKRYKLNLALQGGGSHGAYTWGILDRLMDEEDIDVVGISGTSAGAMNAAIFANGFTKGGRAGAKTALEAFWRDVSLAGMAGLPFQQSPMALMSGSYNFKDSLGYSAFDALTRTFSPYELNPLNVNPLKMILDMHLDLDALKNSKIELFVSATSVHTGRERVFHCHEVTPEALLASACMPFLFQAVEIDGEPYWDGGYMGNPSIWPLIYHTPVSDVLLVQINPITRLETPKTAYAITNRLNEITFNSSLIAEMRAINFVSKLVHENRLDKNKYRDVRMHVVAAGEVLKDLDSSSKMNPRWDFLTYMRDHGRNQMDKWLAAHKSKIGHKGTVDIQEAFLGGPQKHRHTDKSKTRKQVA